MKASGIAVPGTSNKQDESELATGHNMKPGSTNNAGKFKPG